MNLKRIPSDITDMLSAQAQAADELMHFSQKAFEKLKESGLMQIFLPGGDLDFCKNKVSAQLNLLRQIGAADLSVARIYEGHVNALFLIYQFATDDQKSFWFNFAAAGKIFGVWNTEAQDGIKFIQEDEVIRIEGSKTFCSGSTNIDFPIITGHFGDRGWQMAVIDMKTSALEADASFWNPLGMRASISHKIDFSGHRIVADDLLGNPGDYYRQPGFGGGAIRFSAVQIGGAQAIFDGTLAYLRELGRTDDIFQKQRIAEMAILIKSGLQWIESAGSFFEEGTGNTDKTIDMLNMANMMRHAVEDICNRVMQLSEKSVGARGLMRPGKLERIHRDLRYYLRQPAPDATFLAIGDYILKSNKSSDDFWN